MCRMISFLKSSKRIFFITKDELNTKMGRTMLKTSSGGIDALGHGFIHQYFGGEGYKLNSDNEFEYNNAADAPIEVIIAARTGKFNHWAFGTEWAEDFWKTAVRRKTLSAYKKEKMRIMKNRKLNDIQKNRQKARLMWWILIKDKTNLIPAWAEVVIPKKR